MPRQLSDVEMQKLIEAKARAAEDPVFFTNKFLYTFNPRVEPYKFRFELFPYQVDLMMQLKEAIERGEDVFVDKARDVGATYTTLALYLWFWRFVPGSNFLLGSRKEQYIDSTGASSRGLDTVINKEESLFGKLEYLIRNATPFIMPTGFDINRHKTYMSLINPEVGNVIVGEAANPNFSRSGRFKSILLDEFAFWEADTAAWGATADTTNCRIVLTTAGIRPGKAKRLRFNKDGEQIKIIEIDYTLDPRKNAEWEVRERARRSDDDFNREILRNWETSVQGRVYEEIRNAGLGRFPYMPDWTLYTSWDFGLDGTSIGWWQRNPINGKARLVDSYHTSDEPVQYFFPFFGFDLDSQFTYDEEALAAIERVKWFKKGIHFGDPDVAKRAYQDAQKTSTRKELSNKGIHVQTRPEANDFSTRKEFTKLLLQRGIEVNQTPGNEYWLEALQSARYPQRAENSQSTTAISLPIHDWTSHPRTMTEYFAVNFDRVKVGRQEAVDNFQRQIPQHRSLLGSTKR